MAENSSCCTNSRASEMNYLFLLKPKIVYEHVSFELDQIGRHLSVAFFVGSFFLFSLPLFLSATTETKTEQNAISLHRAKANSARSSLREHHHIS